MSLMMMTDYPITPPSELLDEWCMDLTLINWRDIATKATQWGADQELEACVKWLKEQRGEALAIQLRAARRPKPPRLRELALESLKRFEASGEFFSDQMRELEFIRKALEALPE
jgi:hypothetical protein